LATVVVPLRNVTLTLALPALKPPGTRRKTLARRASHRNRIDRFIIYDIPRWTLKKLVAMYITLGLADNHQPIIARAVRTSNSEVEVSKLLSSPVSPFPTCATTLEDHAHLFVPTLQRLNPPISVHKSPHTAQSRSLTPLRSLRKIKLTRCLGMLQEQTAMPNGLELEQVSSEFWQGPLFSLEVRAWLGCQASR